MATSDRLLVFLASILLIVVAVLLGLSAGRLFPLLERGTTFAQLYLYGNWYAVVAALLLLVVGVRLGYLSLTRGQRRGQTLVQRSDLGEINIALSAIENLVQRAAGQIDGVREVRSRVEAKSQGVVVLVKAWVGSDHNVPDLASRIQEMVRERLESIVGISAAEINIAIKDIGSTDQRLKVR
ncbi:MAG: alkaline shock response membrane anchor protein AmaP [Firmicutes bacterium]|nr:alkaline shock response membrane anchor protein AmaP [Bacillota bacterium]